MFLAPLTFLSKTAQTNLIIIRNTSIQTVFDPFYQKKLRLNFDKLDHNS